MHVIVNYVHEYVKHVIFQCLTLALTCSFSSENKRLALMYYISCTCMIKHLHTFSFITDLHKYNHTVALSHESLAQIYLNTFTNSLLGLHKYTYTVALTQERLAQIYLNSCTNS